MKRDKFDILMSRLIRERADWTCERCNTHYPKDRGGGLEHSHIVGRAKKSTRWSPLAGIALCTGCHRHLTAHPIEHEKFARELLGTEKYDDLVLLSHQTRRWEKWEKVELYKQMKTALKDMQERRAMGLTGRLEFYLEAV